MAVVVLVKFQGDVCLDSRQSEEWDGKKGDDVGTHIEYEIGGNLFFSMMSESRCYRDDVCWKCVDNTGCIGE